MFPLPPQRYALLISPCVFGADRTHLEQKEIVPSGSSVRAGWRGWSTPLNISILRLR